MWKKIKKIILGLLLLFLSIVLIVAIYLFWIQPTNSRTKGTTIGIARKVSANKYELKKLTKVPSYDVEKGYSAATQANFRAKDLSKLDMTNHLQELEHAIFDTNTRWPTKLPAGNDPKDWLEKGKNPGLQVRALHKQGVTGKNISIGIIDQTLYTQHQEYQRKLKHYEEIHVLSKTPEMHGAAVASLAVGDSVGVAPDANLYFIASALSDNLLTMMQSKGTDAKGVSFSKGINYQYYAEAIERFIQLNKKLPKQDRIRVISMSRGFNEEDKGYQEFKKAVNKAMEEGIFVVSATLAQEYGVDLAGLGRKPGADPDKFESYSVGSWIKDSAYDYQNRLFVPMDARTYAGVYGPDNYQFDPSGGLSWTVPYIAGLYALACQVKTDVTPDYFVQVMMETSDTAIVENNGFSFKIKYIVNPVRLINKLKLSS